MVPNQAIESVCWSQNRVKSVDIKPNSLSDDCSVFVSQESNSVERFCFSSSFDWITPKYSTFRRRIAISCNLCNLCIGEYWFSRRPFIDSDESHKKDIGVTFASTRYGLKPRTHSLWLRVSVRFMCLLLFLLWGLSLSVETVGYGPGRFYNSWRGDWFYQEDEASHGEDPSDCCHVWHW